ncbi:DUF1033 family protein [Sporosarcina cyprini]|uniref:DUF1033 family protein n=1 Tax=Sporosarcina cyprini TaxID=2910523 RepID=UPI001EDCCABF|nr:DUF1033 family protein [Sporosarcina cyprini]MCG3088800.1 DUF1033 family protein [Sporosarcina cyprini]
MYEVIYMKADYEPWWMFDDWRSMVVTSQSFESKEEANTYFRDLYNKLENEHTFNEKRKNCFFAFWSESERVYCDGCDECLQLYHGIIILQDGNPCGEVLSNNSNS